MNVVVGALIVVGVTAVAVAAMLFVRRGAPEGSYFADGDRASGVFGVLATGFAVLLGFVVFLSFTSYDTARAGAETEALIVAQQVETAQFFDPATAQQLTVGLVCYARSVAGVQWERMEDHTIGDTLNPWGVAAVRNGHADRSGQRHRTIGVRPVDGPDDREREQARNDRIHGAVGVIPTSLWLVLFFTAVVIFAYVLFFADSGERAVVQAMLMGSVVAVIVSMFLLLFALDHPFHQGIGGLQPVAMERTLRVIDEQLAVVGLEEVTACDAAGNPV